MAQVETPTSFPESPLDQDEIIFPCKGCGDILEEGKAFELAGNRWHIDCFRCNTCSLLLDSDANLLLLGDGSLICNSCTYSCNACGNKIEDLAILTGDQAFCSSCFRCRNCKKKIENLRYARTSQGIFCMSCHESLMARRRKKARATPKPTQNGSATVKEKALPSLPPGAAPPSAFSPDIETPPSEATSGTPVARSPPERQYSNRQDMRSNSVKRGVSPTYDDVQRDGPTLPASTYGEPRPSNVSLETEDGEERGFLPMAFDPTPQPAPPPMARKVVPRAQDLSPPAQVDSRARDYFGKPVSKEGRRPEQRPPTTRSMSTDLDVERSGSQAKANPHIFYQDKGRQQKRTSETNTPASTSATASPLTATLQEQSERPKVQQPETGSLAPRSNEGFKLQEAPKARRTGSKTSPQVDSKSPVSPTDGSMKDAVVEKPVSHSPVSTDSPNSSVNPFDDPKRQEPGPTSAAAPPKQVDRPLRGDSLSTSARAANVSTPEMQTPTAASAQIPTATDRKGSESSMPAAFVDAKTGLSRDNSRSKVIESPPMRTSFEAPPPRSSSRQNAANKAVAGEDFTAPRAPPPPPPATVERHRNNESINSYDAPLSPSLRSAGLPKHSMDGAFSMEEEMARILRGDSTKQKSLENASPSVLRKVSQAVKHGRSFSDRAIHGKSSSNGAVEISSPMTISSPMFSSPSGKDTNEALAAQLRRAQHRIAYLEAEVLRMEEKVDSSTEIKAANNELKEKRSTIVVLDSQREMVVRELEAMTEHLAKAKDSNQPLDMNSMKGHILKDFGEALQRLKDQMSAQIEDLIQKRNHLTEEIGNLIQMKDKGFQEYDALSNKNAQLLEMNSQILHNIQDMYKSNKHGSASTANGLGIYHAGGREDAGSQSEMRNLNMISTDSSMPNLLQETEAEPATVLTGPQVVNIRKGQPKKFNWRKGGEKMAKNVTKGLRGAFAGERMPTKDGESPYSIGLPYNQTHQAMGGSELSAASSRQGPDGSKPFGLFAPKTGGLKAGTLGNMKDNSSTNLVLDASILFGSELEARCEYEKRVIPSVVSRCIEEVEQRGIDMEGIYRKSGGSGQVKAIQQGFEKDNNYDISDPDLDIHAVTSTLKQYFRKLPTPLITYDVYDNLLEAGRLQDREKQAMALRMTVAELPEHHRDCLEFLVGHLARVMSNESENLMTTLNLAVVFAPTIMRPESIEREMSDMQAQRIALQALLEHHATVFPEA